MLVRCLPNEINILVMFRLTCHHQPSLTATKSPGGQAGEEESQSDPSRYR